MSTPLSGDWSQLLHTSVFELQDAPELRSVQLDHVAEALAQPGAVGVSALPASVLEPSGQPGILLPQFSGRRLNEALDHAAAMQKLTPGQVADLNLGQCIDEWAKSAAASAAAAPAALPSAVLTGADPAAQAFLKSEQQGMALPGPETQAGYAQFPSAAPAAGGAAFLPQLDGSLLGGLPGAPMPLNFDPGAMPFLPSVALGLDGGSAPSGPISEAARKEAAAAARAARVLKRREEKQRRLERQRKTSGGGSVPVPAPSAAALPPLPPAPLLPQALVPGIPGVAAAPLMVPSVAPQVDTAIEKPPPPATATAAAAAAKPDKAELRAIKNRESAARSRAKRVEYQAQLETKVQELREQNKELRTRVIRAAAAPPDPHAGAVDGQTLRRTRTTPL